mgnify:CR=1 FL=1
MTKDELLALIRNGKHLSSRDQFKLAALLSFPAMLSQLSTIAMEYIDAAMVGSMGATASASIALVSTSLWLLGGLSHSVSTGFYVQVAHHVGGNDFPGARDVYRQGITTSLAFSSLLMNILFFSPMQMGTREGGIMLALQLLVPSVVSNVGTGTPLLAVAVALSFATRLRELIWIAIGLAMMRMKETPDNENIEKQYNERINS